MPPPAVVLANAALGLAAAAAIVRGHLVGAALLLQLKTILDNADGELARVRGRVSALGRYLDTEADLLVNITLFSALGAVTGHRVLALAGLCALTLVLSADFTADVLYRRARGEDVVTQPSAVGEGRVSRMLEFLYGVVFGPQDRLLQGFARKRLDSVLEGVAEPAARRRVMLVYNDPVTVVALANMGLSTQLVALGACLALGVPTVFLWLVLACAASIPVLQMRRERLARRAFSG
jgi:archaetidylinositol phosphate synthase